MAKIIMPETAEKIIILETDEKQTNESKNEDFNNNEPPIEKQNNDLTIKQQNNVEIEVENVLFKTSTTLYTNGEIEIFMMDKVNKNIFIITKTPKDLQKLSTETKLYLEPNYLYDLLVAGFDGKNKDVTLITNQLIDLISIKIWVKLPLGMLVELQLILNRKEQNDAERIGLIAKDIFECRKQLIEREENVLKENKAMKNEFSNLLNKIDYLEKKIETGPNNQLITEKMLRVAVKNYLNSLKNEFDIGLKNIESVRTEFNNQKLKFDTNHNNCIKLKNELNIQKTKFKEFITELNDAITKFIDTKKELDDGKTKVTIIKTKLENQKIEFLNDIDDLVILRNYFNAELVQLKSMKKELNAELVELKSMRKELNDEKIKLVNDIAGIVALRNQFNAELLELKSIREQSNDEK